MHDVTTHIDRVTVYRNGALVVRRGEAAAGSVVVRGLPLLFSSDSLRVRATTGTVTSIRESCSVTGTSPPLPDHVSEIRALDLEHMRLSDESSLLEAEINALAQISPQPLQHIEQPRVVDTGSWAPLVRDTSDLIVAKRASLAQVKRQLRDVDVARARAMALAAGDVSPPRFSRALEFTIDTGSAFELEYFVASARWVPTYALHLRGRKAELVVAALVAQASGEAWEHVKLAFSTADLARDTTLPELASWRIGRAQPAPRRAFRPLPNDLLTLFAGYDAGTRLPALAPEQRGGTPPPPPSSPAPQMRVAIAKAMSLEARDAPVGGATREGMASSRDESIESLLDDDSRVDEDEAEWNEATPLASVELTASRMTIGAPPAPAAASFERARRAPGAARSGGAPQSSMKRVQAPLPPRLRYAYTRLAGPDESERGTLVALDVLQRLSWFVEAHDVSATDALRRAIASLKDAERRLSAAPLPPMTCALGDTFAATVFHSSSSHTIPDDGVFWRVEAERRASDFALELRTVPREAPEVYRFCVLPTPATPLPSGPLAVFEDDVFRVTTSVDHGARGGQPLEINLGVDTDVRVMGRVVHVHQDEKGLVNQTSRITHTVKTTIRSTAAMHRDVCVYDRLPVADDDVKDIKVELVDSKPPAKRSETGPQGSPLQGALQWRLVVQPGSTETIEARYTIDLPAKLELVGGNRRE
jgi:hypothetical protein